MLSVILKNSDYTDKLEKLCAFELRGEEAELIRADSWQEGLDKSKGQYVCFLEGRFALSDDYFHNLLDVFLDQPSFRKMAMVTPSLAKVHWNDKRIYGYSVQQNLTVSPTSNRNSSSTYSIEIGYIPGAIIRKAVLTELPMFFGDNPLSDSIYLSLRFWNSGQRCLLNPRVTYFTDAEDVDGQSKVARETDVSKLLVLFKREMI